ncbi:MAG: hypothetical protein K6E29_01645 [Cyanobacteria bacterium RUI128]|nr:hypothetical protein [Cyanobacteria bacterium RUI128]
MGMSSSQARLLNLTARMHQIEYKAAKLEAQKLQMANESRRVYEEYLIALDATKVQYSSIAPDGSIVFKDANMNILQNGVIYGYTGEHSNEVLFMQRKNGTIMLTKAVADANSIPETGVETRDMDTYIRETTHEEKTKLYGTKWEDDTSHIASFTPVPNSGIAHLVHHPILTIILRLMEHLLIPV